MKILLTNDDGINASGIYALAKELEKSYELVIVAPDNEKSASSHSITIKKALFVKEVHLDGLKSKAYSLSGTPADCVKFAIDRFSNEKIDIVLSGINNGTNIGSDILYSGTVSAAIEAASNNVPSMAVSLEFRHGVESDYAAAAKYAVSILDKVKDKFLKGNIVLNLNIPIKINGLKVCRIGGRSFSGHFIEKNYKDGENGFILKGEAVELNDNDTDVYFIKNGYATLTPLHYDFTNFKLFEKLNNVIY
ncbi:5'/3'-nucleotidase SurE [Clostridium fermenticellae]|uniref:5'-nucleotidase SurE n=1 Tax=Clostridium fermenticellae TaxID=2068654 RepID=A0A386H3F1_9CLOT|nr:5'/3'-nucleotidase SurE [Clostridium fermenticellae]AYD40251.1 5'/3'-nucleotidase SurE [Clostridium fermenticellae]